MKALFINLAAAGLIAGSAGASIAQDDATIIHKESADGVHSKTVVARNDASKTIIKRGLHHVKKVHINANGDKTVIRKSTEAGFDPE